MIRYQLQCTNEHSFEAWFTNSASYDAQAAAGHIACPVCGSSKVDKAVMAPNISPRSRQKGGPVRQPERGSGDVPSYQQESSKTPPPEQASEECAHMASRSATTSAPESFAIHSEFTDLMRKVRREVERTADYVGPNFAEEARKIHNEESQPRGIYGEGTEKEVTELNDEGIEFYPLPRLPEDNN